ncbi:MAG: hypothetical protein KF689_11860 [Gemmatimonadaceae bacterium]|nr:hypothetical protein [Gemmatimonadaceae bacterium]MCW5827326.1 hypothetical protein [Gemmatimonadaceae bacterium]
MKWKTFIPTSLGLAVLAMAGITALSPKASQAQGGDCGPYNGQMCNKECLKECEQSPNCCNEIYRYYKAVE